MVNGLRERFGGTAGNIAYNLALLGEKPIILATAGKDFAPYREWLVRLGLPLTGIKEIPGDFTAGAYITTDLSDNQITGFNPGAMKHLSDYRFEGVDAAAAYAIVAPGGLEDMLLYTRAYQARGCPISSTPARASRPGRAAGSGRWPPGPRPSSSMTTSWRCCSKRPA